MVVSRVNRNLNYSRSTINAFMYQKKIPMGQWRIRIRMCMFVRENAIRTSNKPKKIWSNPKKYTILIECLLIFPPIFSNKLASCLGNNQNSIVIRNFPLWIDCCFVFLCHGLKASWSIYWIFYHSFIIQIYLKFCNLNRLTAPHRHFMVQHIQWYFALNFIKENIIYEFYRYKLAAPKGNKRHFHLVELDLMN